MSRPGEVAFVLHTHLPWLKNHGVWPVGEEWLFQAWSASWYPVTRMLRDLAREGHRNVLTLGVTPLVAWQVDDLELREGLGVWLGSQMWRAEEQRQRRPWIGDGLADLGPFYWRHYQGLLAFHEEVEQDGGLLAVWAELQRQGVIEILGGPATHPYLPLITDPELIDGQLACGLDWHREWLRAPTTGLWAPEMAYRPGGTVADATREPTDVDHHGTPTLPRHGRDVPGLEEHYERHGVTHFLVDAATLVRAVGGEERDWTTRPELVAPGSDDPYDIVHDGVYVGDTDVVAFARDLSVAYHVWSPTDGYPGDPWYRDFYATGSIEEATFGMHPSWRVTDKALAGHLKDVYVPERGTERAHVHAEHLLGVLHEVLDPRPGELVVAAYDTELFGHWWFEGVQWLESLLRRIHDDAGLVTTTLASRLERRPPARRLDLPESSWGFAKGHASWVTDDTRRLWTQIADAEDLARRAVPHASQEVASAIARELAQLHCSDWPFMMTRGKAFEYAAGRFDEHLRSLQELCEAVLRGEDPIGHARWRQTLVAAPLDASALTDALTSVFVGSDRA